jgi:uncharacterized protein YlxP (DUF503 family)
MIVAAYKLDLYFPAVHSLKEKRHILKKIISRTRSRFSVSIAEVGAHDLWQRGEIGLCIVGNDTVQLNSLMSEAVRFIEDMHLGEIISHESESFHL